MSVVVTLHLTGTVNSVKEFDSKSKFKFGDEKAVQ